VNYTRVLAAFGDCLKQGLSACKLLPYYI